jgi:hypothetical protein
MEIYDNDTMRHLPGGAFGLLLDNLIVKRIPESVNTH